MLDAEKAFDQVATSPRWRGLAPVKISFPRSDYYTPSLCPLSIQKMIALTISLFIEAPDRDHPSPHYCSLLVIALRGSQQVQAIVRGDTVHKVSLYADDLLL